MAGIMDFFRPTNNQQTAQQNNSPQNNGQGGGQGNQQTGNNQQLQGNTSGQGGPGTNPNGGNNNQNNNNNQPGGNNQNAGTQGEPKGLDRFSKMWETTNTQADAPPAFTLDPKVINEVASQQDFMQGLDPELMQKATSGDISSLIQLMGKVSQNAYAKSLEHASTLTGKFVDAREAHSSKNLGNNVRKELTTSALSAIPNFKHPVVQRQLKETAEKLQKLHPDAAPQEIAEMAIEYYQELVTAIKGDNDDPTKNQKNQKAETNWDEFFDVKEDEN